MILCTNSPSTKGEKIKKIEMGMGEQTKYFASSRNGAGQANRLVQVKLLQKRSALIG